MSKSLGESLILIDYEQSDKGPQFAFNTDNLKYVLRNSHDSRIGALIVIGSARLGKSTLCEY